MSDMARRVTHPFTLYTSGTYVRGMPRGSFRGVKPISTLNDFHDVVCFNWTNLRRENGRRRIGNFLGCDCIVGDIDNEIDDPNTWVEPCDVTRRLPGVEMLVQYSTHHMLPKDGNAPRPKFHFLLPCEPIHNETDYSDLWNKLRRIVPEMDESTFDLSRIYWGNGTAKVDYFEGSMNFTEFLEAYPEYVETFPEVPKKSCGRAGVDLAGVRAIDYGDKNLTIKVGSRHNELFRAAKDLVYVYGKSNIVIAKLMDLATNHCVPPYIKPEDLADLKEIIRSVYAYHDGEIVDATTSAKADFGCKNEFLNVCDNVEEVVHYD